MRPIPPIHHKEQDNYKDLFDQTYKILHGNTSFGDGTNSDNIDGAWGLDGAGSNLITTPAVANTAFTVTHNLGRIPKFWDIKYQDKAASIYDSGVAWTSTTISLKCSVATVKIRIFVH